jgi:DNA repair protein SbcC/Rad50
MRHRSPSRLLALLFASAVVAAACAITAVWIRTVGLVTHVRDLADRMPVRFEVRRGPRGSTVERVEV